MTTLHVIGIQAFGRHGANAGEREQPQEFVVDLDVEVEPTEDELEATADYRDVVAAVRRVVETESVVLLETLAARIRRAVCDIDGVREALVSVHKPGAAIALDVDDVVAETSTE